MKKVALLLLLICTYGPSVCMNTPSNEEQQNSNQRASCGICRQPIAVAHGRRAYHPRCLLLLNPNKKCIPQNG